MTLLRVIKCDGCNRQVELGRTAGWYTVMLQRTEPDWADRDAESFDFCSLPCIALWTRHRELVSA